MLNSVRLSLLLARTAVGAAPGLLPVAGFPQVSSSRFRCAMVKRDYDDDLEKWTGDKEGAEDFDDAAAAQQALESALVEGKPPRGFEAGSQQGPQWPSEKKQCCAERS